MTTADTHIHDLIGIGIGPFGLGLAALSDPLPDVDAVFLDQRPEFRWHPGMMIEGSTVQVPFLADLVTMADPTSRFSFLQFLKDRGRLYPFYIRESFYPLRAEFDEYCRWVADQLDTLRWNRRVTSVTRDDDIYIVTAEVADESGAVVRAESYRARHLVLGVGTQPVLPEVLQNLAGGVREGMDSGNASGPVVHTSDYLDYREELLASGSITIIGSGQSAAEIYRDLIEEAESREVRLDWVTRSPRFFPMEYTKLTLEMTSPEYTDHFRALPADLREQLGREQRTLYKGISSDLVDDIHDTLYRLSRGGRKLRTSLIADAELIGAAPATGTDDASGADCATGTGHGSGAGDYALRFRHTTLGETFERRSGAIVAATGYKSQVPDFLAGLGDEIRLDDQGRLDVSRHYTINDAGSVHVLNGEEHTHGVTAPDLGFGPWRASVVLAHVTGREPYPIEERIAFQTFGIPADQTHDAANDDRRTDVENATATDNDFASRFAFTTDTHDLAEADDVAEADDREMTHV